MKSNKTILEFISNKHNTIPIRSAITRAYKYATEDNNSSDVFSDCIIRGIRLLLHTRSHNMELTSDEIDSFFNNEDNRKQVICLAVNISGDIE